MPMNQMEFMKKWNQSCQHIQLHLRKQKRNRALGNQWANCQSLAEFRTVSHDSLEIGHME